MGTAGKITESVHRHPALSLAGDIPRISSVEIHAPILAQSATLGESSKWMEGVLEDRDEVSSAIIGDFFFWLRQVHT